MKLFSLNDHDEWALWRSNSDYFYPEMIPEPDYSDSGDEADGSEDEECMTYTKNLRPASERLPDVTEVYVTHADVKLKKNPSPKVSSKQGSFSKRQAAKMPTDKRQQGKMSPKTLPKAPRKTQSKSPARGSKPASPTPKSLKSQESAKKTPIKTKSPPSKLVATASIKRGKSPESPKKSSARPKSPVGDSKPKPTRSKSPKGGKKVSPKTKSPVRTATPEKLKANKPLAKSRPESQVKSVLTETKSSASKTKSEAGDGPKLLPLFSPTTDESKSGLSSALSTEHSSDDDLIKPRKPYQLSPEKQKLHKELKFSQRYGKLVPSKTELQLAIERFTENKEKKELEVGEKTSLEKILAIQARKLNIQDTTEKSPSWIDHLQRPPATLPNPKTEEFYRVHARVVNNNTLTQCFMPDDDHSEYLSSQTLTHTESGSDS